MSAKPLGRTEHRVEVTVQVKVVVSSTANRGTIEMLALEASSHNEYDPDVSSVLERKYGTAEVTDQTIIGYDELPAKED